MYERLLDKSHEPALEQIKEYLGNESHERFTQLEKYLQTHYLLTKELRFPFGNSYGWGYKYSHKSAHLCYAFFEEEAFTVTIQIGDKQVPVVENALNSLSPKTQKLWEERYPCGGNGGWVHFRVLRDEELKEVYTLISAKKKPI